MKKLGLIVLPLVFLTACASQQTTSAPVDEMATLKASVQQALDAANAAQSSADTARLESATALRTASSAQDSATSAQATANAAQSAVDECCAKIDRMFEKTMQK